MDSAEDTEKCCHTTDDGIQGVIGVATCPPVIRTEWLELRLPTPVDVAAVYELHFDPATYRHVPQAVMTTSPDAENRLQDWLSDWQVNGIGYRMVHTRVNGYDELVGCVGTRLITTPGFFPSPVLNLYYRLAPRLGQRPGRGSGRRRRHRSETTSPRGARGRSDRPGQRGVDGAGEQARHAADAVARSG